MSANPFTGELESGEASFELGNETNELCRTLSKMSEAAEALNVMDKRYETQVGDMIKPLLSADREAQGRYRTHSDIHEITQALSSGVKHELESTDPNPVESVFNIKEADIKNILQGITEENAEERFALLKKIQDEMGQDYSGLMKDRYDKFHHRGRIKIQADDAENKSHSLSGRAANEESSLNIKDGRLSNDSRKYRDRARTFAENVSVLNSKAKTFEVENLESIEEEFKNFNRVVTVIKNTLGVEQKA